eukprot:TRINITY_DN7953_c0_g1_i1.p1 TRINITY_DN7953_c0_g1~~TRINITY_DN7953_c0_g1_i1.p1  ORF type:complete len:602 (-),score=83.07 TRINITY_DN7953_c0_g1_i1:56-1861(-)
MQSELIQWAQRGDLDSLVSCIEQLRNPHSLSPQFRVPSTNWNEDFINTTDESGNTLLHWACYRRHKEVARYLISKRASIQLRNTQTGQTALHWAAIGGDVSIVHTICQNYYGIEEADPSYGDSMGYNVMHHAAMGGHVDLLHYCIAVRGISVDCFDKDGHTPLHWAAFKGKEMALRYLIKAGSNISLADPTGRTAIHWASQAAKPDALLVLQEAGASVTVPDRNGETPLDLARKKNTISVIEFLSKPKLWYKKRSKTLWWLLGISTPPWILYIINEYSLFASLLILISSISLAGYFVTHTTPVSHKERNPFLLTFMISVYLVSGVVYYREIIGEIGFNEEYPFLNIVYILLYILWAVVLGSILWGNPGKIQPVEMNVPFFRSERRNEFLISQRYPPETQIFLEHVVRSEDPSPPSICPSCLIVRPIRSKHCSACNHCVVLFDHHCTWLDGCVGGGNIREFALFVLCMFTLQVLYTIIAILSLLLSVKSDSWLEIFSLREHYTNYPSIVVLMFMHSLLSLGVGRVFVGILQYNVLQGLTVNEIINRHRYRYLESWVRNHDKNPFDLGTPLKNIQHFLWGDLKKWFHTYHIVLPNDLAGVTVV